MDILQSKPVESLKLSYWKWTKVRLLRSRYMDSQWPKNRQGMTKGGQDELLIHGPFFIIVIE